MLRSNTCELALDNIEATQESPTNRAFWWVSLAFVESLFDQREGRRVPQLYWPGSTRRYVVCFRVHETKRRRAADARRPMRWRWRRPSRVRGRQVQAVFGLKGTDTGSSAGH